MSGPQDLTRFVNPTPSAGQWNHDLPHVRTIPAHVIIHGVKGLTVRGVEVMNAAAEPRPGMHGMWLEQDERVEGFRRYPLQSGFKTVIHS